MQHAFLYSWSINPSSYNASKCVTCFSVMEPQAPPAGYAWWWKKKKTKKKKQGKWIWHQTLIDVLVLVLVLLILRTLILLCLLLGHPSLPSRGDPSIFLRSSEVGFLLLSCFLCAFLVQNNREIPKWAEVKVVASAFNLLSPHFSLAQNTRVERKERKVRLCVALVEDDGFLPYQRNHVRIVFWPSSALWCSCFASWFWLDLASWWRWCWWCSFFFSLL